MIVVRDRRHRRLRKPFPPSSCIVRHDLRYRSRRRHRHGRGRYQARHAAMPDGLGA